MKKLIILLLFVIPAGLFGQESTISKERIRENIKYLASDSLEGRFPGTPGIELAAKRIISEFKGAGVKPFKGNYRQEFGVTTGVELGDGNYCTWTTLVKRIGLPKDKWRKLSMPWKVGKDYQPMAFSDNDSVSGELAFVGFGISAPDLNYDDYEGIDVNDKIAIILSETPDGEDRDGEFSNYRSLRYKVSNAKMKGAKAVIFVRLQGDSMNVFYRLNWEHIGSNSGIPVIQAWRQSLTQFFPKDKNLIGVEEGIKATKKPNSYYIPDTEVSFAVDLKEVESPTDNIIGIVEGTDSKLKDEYIVIGAHYDHLGWGGGNSRYNGMKQMIHNGADDNSSGVAAMIELAHHIAQNPLRRSVIFMGFSAEEMGLLGSNHFVEEPLLGLDNIAAMLNLDMVGRLRNNDITIFGTGSSPMFSVIIDSIAAETGIRAAKSSDAYGPSDHASFYRKDIPVMMLFTGLHDDYHMPSDDWNKINFEGVAAVAEFGLALAQAIDRRDSKPEFTETKIPMPDKGEGGRKSHGYGGVWFGIVPNFETSDLGLKISGTSAGSPAEKAGLADGDIITKMDDAVITNLYDFMYKIKNHKPGDKIMVELLRGGNPDKKETVEVTVTARKGK
jgi:aminopeptidase YwaD